MIGYYNTIANYYRDLHRLKKYGGYSILEINTMIPWEFEIYTYQVLKDLQDEEERRK